MLYKSAICLLAFASLATAVNAAEQKKMEKFRSEFSSNKSLNDTAGDMKKIASEVDKVYKQNGYDDKECHTVCTTTMTVGPDGKLVPSVSCSLQCGF
ncbi:MAG TPA: hypothetical protein K8W01_00190 [Methylorubrum populi]|uniref:Uncharacterized protein n=1 Tax=Methylorubrum populi TaxID=223967 RepID=A0A921DZQ8_9HYPH|nr:hypothetical protein [Methylorubrum populi]